MDLKKLRAIKAQIMMLVAMAHARADGRLDAVRQGFLVGAERGQGTNLVGLFIGLMIATIVAVQVMIPVVNDAIASANLSGTTKTVVELIPLFAALLLLIALASPLMRRI